jgi:ectoine hydroxylase-related dioxygenase (phytanoyl-CoA dioxygenase family)
MGGSLPVRFPGEADPGDAGWHIEASYEEGGQQRVNAGSRARGLLALYLLTDVDPEGAPTRLRPGSHRDVPPLLAPAGDAGMEWLPAAQQAARASAHHPTRLATGRAGDVFLCHPFLVHAASWPHRGHRPRMIAQPAVALHGQYALRAAPGETPPPVQQVILDSLAAAAR